MSDTPTPDTPPPAKPAAVPSFITDETKQKVFDLFPDRFVLVYVADKATMKASVAHNGDSAGEMAAGVELMRRLAGEKASKVVRVPGAIPRARPAHPDGD